MNEERVTISLVLGSGGARGLAHIGVIQVLEERGYRIRSIAGSSMGALIGGVYAAGQLETYARWVCSLERMDVLKMLDISFSGAAIFKGERIINTLREMIGEWVIEDLPISFTAVATALEEGKEVWLSRGSLFDAIRASIAFPTIFSSFNVNGRKLVDGGLVNPIPIAPTLRDSTDLTIAVSLSGRASASVSHGTSRRESPSERSTYHQKLVEFIENFSGKANAQPTDEGGFFEVISQSIDTMQNTIARLKLAANSPDLLIEIPKDACMIYEFERAAELVDIGRRWAEKALSDMP